MKKLFTTLCVFAGLMLTACGGTNESKSADQGGKSSGDAQNTDSYQFEGKLEEGGGFESFTDAAYFLNLSVDGKTSLDKYAFATYDASDAATNSSYSVFYQQNSTT